MNNLNVFYHSNTLSSIMNDATSTTNETCDNLQCKLKLISNINNNVNTCSCMLHLILLQVCLFQIFTVFFKMCYSHQLPCMTIFDLHLICVIKIRGFHLF